MFPVDTTFLVVDDAELARSMARTCLEALGYTRLIEAPDGVIALDLLQKNFEKPEPSLIGLILSDWNMPQMDGLEFLKRVRGDDKFAKLPFIMVTTEGEQASMVQAAKAGASNYISKPISQEVLQKKLEAVFKKIQTTK